MRVYLELAEVEHLRHLAAKAAKEKRKRGSLSYCSKGTVGWETAELELRIATKLARAIDLLDAEAES